MTAVDTELRRAASSTGRGAEKFSHWAVLGGVGVGFALGALVMAAVLPLLTGHKHRRAADTLPTPVPYSAAGVRAQIKSLADTALGKYGSTSGPAGADRLVSVAVTAVVPYRYPANSQDRLYDLSIKFLLQSNVTGPTIQVGEAKTDCFRLLQALYSHDLPLNTIDLYGEFRLPSAKHEQVLLHAGSDRSIELDLAPWNNASPTVSPQVWQHLRPAWISPRFANYRP